MFANEFNDLWRRNDASPLVRVALLAFLDQVRLDHDKVAGPNSHEGKVRFVFEDIDGTNKFRPQIFHGSEAREQSAEWLISPILPKPTQIPGCWGNLFPASPILR